MAEQRKIIWNSTHGTYLTGQSYIDQADLTAGRLEAKWGSGRLRLLVDAELRARFDRQRYLHQAAILHGDLEQVRTQSERMVRAWQALDKTAEATGALKQDPLVWEIATDNGSVVAIVFDSEDISRVRQRADGRRITVYTLAEVARFLQAYPDVAAVKAKWPGAEVVAIRRELQDPLDAIRDGVSLDDPLDDLWQQSMTKAG